MGAIQSIKILALKVLSRLHVVRLRFKGVQLGRECMINVAPRIRRCPGSRIVLGNNVTLTSNPRHNPLMVQPVSIRTMTSEAVVEMDDNSGMTGARIVCFNRVSIGKHTIIGADTLIYDSDGHTYTPERGWNTPRLMTGRPIIIGNKCFIGTRCIILGGVTIGDNCVISAGSVVTHDIPAGHSVQGNPAVAKPLPKALGGASVPFVVSSDAIEKPESELSEQACSFLSQLQEWLELPYMPHMNDDFRDYEEWDSLAFLTLTTILKDDFAISLTSEQFNKFRTWQDVYNLIYPRNHN